MRRLITTDSHLVPPPTVFHDMPEAMRQDAFVLQRYEERDDGRYVVYGQVRQEMQERTMRAAMPAEVKIKDDRHYARLINSAALAEDAFPAFTPEERLADMRREGVEAAVLIGNPEFNTKRGDSVTAAQVAYCELANDWLADTYRDHLDVFAPGINLPWMDVAACVKELERSAAKGLRPAVMPDGIWDHPYHMEDWEPLWEAAAALRIPITMHIAAIRNPPPAAASPAYAGTGFESFYGLCADMGKTLMALALSGTFEKYPDLTVVMTEGYAFWLAGAIQFVDHHYEGNFGSNYPLKKLEALPGDYIRRQAKATFMWDPAAINNRHLTGVESIMWGNDYPHAEGIFPDSQVLVDKQFDGVDEAEIEAMTFSTARDLFGFKV